MKGIFLKSVIVALCIVPGAANGMLGAGDWKVPSVEKAFNGLKDADGRPNIRAIANTIIKEDPKFLAMTYYVASHYPQIILELLALKHRALTERIMRVFWSNEDLIKNVASPIFLEEALRNIDGFTFTGISELVNSLNSSVNRYQLAFLANKILGHINERGGAYAVSNRESYNAIELFKDRNAVLFSAMLQEFRSNLNKYHKIVFFMFPYLSPEEKGSKKYTELLIANMKSAQDIIFIFKSCSPSTMQIRAFADSLVMKMDMRVAFDCSFIYALGCVIFNKRFEPNAELVEMAWYVGRVHEDIARSRFTQTEIDACRTLFASMKWIIINDPAAHQMSFKVLKPFFSADELAVAEMRLNPGPARARL